MHGSDIGTPPEAVESMRKNIIVLHEVVFAVGENLR